MKIIETKLYIEFADFIKAGWKEPTVWQANLRNGEYWMMIKNPSDKRKPLVQFETLRPKDKEKLTLHFGNLYEWIAKEPIKALVEKDLKAMAFYLAYEFDNGMKLPLPTETNHIERYTVAASWLNMFGKCLADKKFIKTKLNLPVLKFIEKVCHIIEAENIALPHSYKRLRETLREYQGNKGEAPNYACLIDWRWNNTNGLKVKDELSQAVLHKLVQTPNAVDVVIARAYNDYAKKNGCKTIGRGTVGNYRRDNEPMLLNGKEGAKAWFNAYGKVIKRRRASCPMACWEHDDNDLDLYYKKNKITKKGNTQVYYYGRFVIAVVMDTYNDYIVGWAMAEVYTKDLIRLAYLDAMYHVKEQTGGWYLPHQIRSDRFGLDPKLTNDLAQFYQRIATYTPAKAKSPRGKYIEQSFGKKWHQVLGTYDNYAGHNITSKAGINNELIELNKKNYPSEQEAPWQIAQFIEQMRNLQQVEDGPSKQDVWLQAFEGSDIAKQNLITDEHLLYLMGTTHQFKNQIGDNKVQITSRGIEVHIGKHFHEFDIDDSIYMDVVGKRVHVIYEPYNLNRVLVTDGHKLRFVAQKLTEEMKMPSALIDYKPGDRTRINNKIAAMLGHVELFTKDNKTGDDLLLLNHIDTKGLIQSGMLIKGQKQAAELQYQNSLMGTGDALMDAADRL